MKDKICAAAGLIGGGLSWLLGGWSSDLTALLICMLAYTVTTLIGSYLLSPIINHIAGVEMAKDASFFTKLADSAITAAARELAASLPALPSVQASARDQAYIDSLTGILGVDSGAETLYHAEIDAFNQRMSASLTGKLAMFCGVEPLPQ